MRDNESIKKDSSFGVDFTSGLREAFGGKKNEKDANARRSPNKLKKKLREQRKNFTNLWML